MPRLPNVGDDSGTWGTILNEYLGVSHTPEGSLMFERWANAAARPAAPTTNQVGFNIETESIEQYDGAAWVTLAGGSVSGVTGDGTGVTDATAFREEIDAQSTAIGFLDRFDRRDRYAENATITHNVSLPEIGGVPYRVATNGSPRPMIVSRALEAVGDSLDYFANQVTTTDGKFNLGLVVEFKRSAVYATAANNGGFTIAVSEQELVSSGAGIGGISGTNPVHFTIRPDGISDSAFYLAGYSLTCLNGTSAGGVIPWNSQGTSLPYNQKIAILFRIKGDILEVEAVGVGTLYFTHPDLSTKVGATTYFWYEPNGPDLGTDYWHVPRLYRWWVNADELDQLAGYGVTVPEVSGGPHLFPGQVRVFPNGQTARRTVDGIPTNSSMVLGAPASVAKGSYNRTSGGALYSEVPIVQNYGYFEMGASQPGFMIGAIDTNLNAVVSSSAGAEANLASCSFVPISGLENGDWQQWAWRGVLTGANNKRIRLNIAYGGGDPGTPGNLLDSGTITTSGFYEIRLHRYTNSTASHTFYATMHANGTLVAATRTAWNGTTNYVGGTFKVTTVDAGAVTVDSYTNQIARVNAT